MLFTGPFSGYNKTIHTVATDTSEEIYGINVIMRMGILKNTNLFRNVAKIKAPQIVRGTYERE